MSLSFTFIELLAIKSPKIDFAAYNGIIIIESNRVEILNKSVSEYLKTADKKNIYFNDGINILDCKKCSLTLKVSDFTLLDICLVYYMVL